MVNNNNDLKDQSVINENKKNKKKSINSFVVMFSVLVIVAVLTWFIPGGQYQLDESGNAIAGTYMSGNSNPQGIWDIVTAPIIGMIGNETVSGAIAISLYVMLFGSFLNMMEKAGVIRVALGSISKKFKSSINLLVLILMFVLSFLGTSQGAYEEGYVYVSLFLPIFLALGYDTVFVLMFVIFGTMAGNAAGIINPFATGIAHEIAGIPFGEGILPRSIIFVVITLVSFIIVTMYGRKIQKDPSKSVQYYRMDEDKKIFLGQASDSDEVAISVTGREKALIAVFIITFVIMFMALFPWTSINENFTLFSKFADWINSTPILSTVIGRDVVPFGEWYFVELSALMLVSTLISGFIAGYTVDENINIIVDGAKSLLSTAFMVPLARGVQLLMMEGNITATLLHATEISLGALPTSMFILVVFIIYTIFASILPSSTGLAGMTISIMVPLGQFAGVPAPVMVMIYNFALAIAKIYSPTSVIVMTCIEYAKIDYGSWIKAVWKPLLLFVITCLIMTYLLVYL